MAGASTLSLLFAFDGEGVGRAWACTVPFIRDRTSDTVHFPGTES